MKLHRTVLALGLLALCAGIAAGQVTTGSLSGQVLDQEGGALPGVTIQAVNENTGTRYTVVTGPDGRFNIVNVKLGDYGVTASLEGFRASEATGVQVRLGEATDLSFELQLETISEELVVVGESNPLISPARTGAASNVSAQDIENLPTIGRGLDDFARTNPFFTQSAENEDPVAISVAGRSSRYNNIQIDGSVNNDLFGLSDQGTPGGQANTTPISLDAIDEIQLVLADYDVRQGGFSGGSINAVTRSGTNDLNGSLYYFSFDDGLVGDGPKELGTIGTFSDDQYGFRLGGPISQDKVFYFLNAEISEREEPTGWSIDGVGGQQFGAGAETLADAERFRNILINNYGFDPGGLAENTRPTDSDKIFGRLDFNVNDNNTLTLRHNYVDATNLINRPSSGTYEFPSEGYDFASETNSTVLQLNSVLGSDKFNEFRVALQTIRDRRGGVATPAFPWIEVEQVGEGGDFEFEAGTEPFSTRNALDQDILEFTNDFTWVLGDHTVTLGTHNELFEFDNLFVQNAFGSYEFSTLDDLEAGISRRYNYTFVNEGKPDSQKFKVNQVGLYVGDQWAAKPNLSLTYGLRVDIPFFPDSPSRNPLTEDLYGLRTDTIPDGETLWQPRVGFNWDPKSDGKQQLRGGVGLFAGRTPYVWISNSYARTGIEQTNVQAFGVPIVTDINNQPVDVGGASTGEFNLIDPNFQFPQVLRYNLAYDQQLPWWDLVASIELVYSDSQEEIDYRDVNLQESGQVRPYDGRPIMEKVDSGVTGAYLITNTSQGEATNLAVKLERPYRDGWSAFVSYAYGDSKTVNDGTSSRAVSNFQFTEVPGNPNEVPVSTSDFNVEHRFNASLQYRFNRDTNFPTTVSAFYNLQSGRPFSNIYGFQSFPTANGDGYFSNDLMYVPSGPDDVVIGDGTWEELDAFLKSVDCLDGNRGRIAPRNCGDAPWSHSLDIRIAQDIPIRGTSLQITADILNVMNLFDSSSGVVRYANFNAITPVDWIGVTDDGLPIYDLDGIVTDPDQSKWQTSNLSSRWRAKLGIRWSF